MFYADNFHLIELMQAIQAPDVLAVSSGFATETSRIGGILYRQVLFVKMTSL